MKRNLGVPAWGAIGLAAGALFGYATGLWGMGIGFGFAIGLAVGSRR